MHYTNEKPPAFTEGQSRNCCGLPTASSLAKLAPGNQHFFHNSPDAADADGELEPHRKGGATVPPATGWSIADVLDGAAFIFAVLSIVCWGAL